VGWLRSLDVISGSFSLPLKLCVPDWERLASPGLRIPLLAAGMCSIRTNRWARSQGSCCPVIEDRLGQVTRAPFCQEDKEIQRSDPHGIAYGVFDSLYLPAEVCAGDDPLPLHLAQALNQHLLGRSRDASAKLAQANRAIQEQQQNLNPPFSPEQVQRHFGSLIWLRMSAVGIVAWRSRDKPECDTVVSASVRQGLTVPAIIPNRSVPCSFWLRLRQSPLHPQEGSPAASDRPQSSYTHSRHLGSWFGAQEQIFLSRESASALPIMSTLVVNPPPGRCSRMPPSESHWEELTWSWAWSTGHRASDQKLEPAAKAAWPYALLCAWSYLNDRDAAHDLMDHAVRKANEYFDRHPEVADQKLVAHFKSFIRRRAQQMARKQSHEIAYGLLPDLEHLLIGSSNVEQRVIADEMFARLSPVTQFVLNRRHLGYTWREVAVELEVDHTVIRRAYFRELKSLLRSVSRSGESPR